MAVVGHAENVVRLERELPPVSLFLGPASVGKWTTAEHLRRQKKISDADILRVRSLTADAARILVDFSSTAPSGQKGKLAIVRLKDARPASLHTLLKTLETSAPTNHFILIAEDAPLDTILSRCQVYRFGLLTSEEVKEVLVTRRNFKPEQAAVWSEASGGHVQRALDFHSDIEAKPTILTVLRAFREHDEKLLESVSDKWTDDLSALLAEWCRENLTKRWRIFSEAESEIPGTTIPMHILAALRADIRPRLVVRSSLMTVLRGL